MEPGEEDDEGSGLNPPAVSQSILESGSWDSGCESTTRGGERTLGGADDEETEDPTILMGVPRGGGGGA